MLGFALLFAMSTDPLVVGPLHLGESVAETTRTLGANAGKASCEPGYVCSEDLAYSDGSWTLLLKFGGDHLLGVRIETYEPDVTKAVRLRQGVAPFDSWRWMGYRVLGPPPSALAGFRTIAPAHERHTFFRRSSIGLEAGFGLVGTFGLTAFTLGRE